MPMEIIHPFKGGDGANVISEETTRVNRISLFGAASSSSSAQVVPTEDTDVGNDQMGNSEVGVSGDVIHHVISSADESHQDEIAAIEPQVPIIAAPLALVPSLRGKLITDGALNICRGVWAMSDAAHEIPEHTSDFEFRLMKATPESTVFPYSGKYQGWFTLKQPPPIKGSIKIEDRDMFIKFCANVDGTFKVEGNGTNKFGKFTLRGMLGIDHMMQIYREYQYKPLQSPRKRAHGIALEGVDGENGHVGKPSKKKMIPHALSTATAVDGIKIENMGAFREGAGRARKPSSIIKDPDDHLLVPKLPTKAVPALPVRVVLPIKPSAAASVLKTESGRAQRPPPQMLKCSDLLKELMKMPQALWFSEPVDPVKMNLPDYTLLIKQPMDFGTIRANLDKGMYDSPEALADHIRLTFRNAIAYNQMRDNPVHIAAREMAGRFEDKYRIMQTQLLSGSYAAQEEVYENKVGRPIGSSGSRKSGVGGGAKVKSNSLGGVARQRSMGGPGPRPIENFFPQVPDASTQTIMMMQRQMEAMASELKQLRTKVMQSEVKNDLEFQRDAAQNPLTFQEKKSLISKIHQLPASKMQQVVDIIKDAIPPEKRGEGDEIEIPLDELDTFTLRKLQSFVEEHNTANAKKKSNVATKEGAVGCRKPRKEKSAPVGRAPGSGAAPKKAISNSSSAAVSGRYSTGAHTHGSPGDDQHTGGDMMDSIEEDDMFFSNESFDDLRAQAAENGNSDASDNEEDMAPVYSTHSSTHQDSGQGQGSSRSRSDSILSDGFDGIMSVRAHPADGGDDMRVANVSAWGRQTSSAPNQQIREIVSGVSPRRDEKGGIVDLWSSANTELEAKQKREQERKIDEERNMEQRQRRESDRMSAINQQALERQQEKQDQIDRALLQKEHDMQLLQQRRENERIARDNMVMTVDLASHNGILDIDLNE